MARKTKTVIITTDDSDNRDKDKVFVITEMSAFAADIWAKRAILACAKGNIDQDLLRDIEHTGLAGVAALGFKFFGALRWEDAQPLLDELMGCVKYMPTPTEPKSLRPIGLGGAEDIEEVATISFLQMEAFNIHLNFTKAAAALKSRLAALMERIGATPATPT